MPFMRPDIEKGQWIRYESKSNGTTILSGDCWNVLPKDAENVEVVDGYGARLSAPGYLDWTDWTVFETEAEAAQFLLDTYYDYEESASDRALLREMAQK